MYQVDSVSAHTKKLKKTKEKQQVRNRQQERLCMHGHISAGLQAVTSQKIRFGVVLTEQPDRQEA
jgi:hypothetical protein